ncbi:MAG: cation-efflux pump [Chloroflexi bacterium]|nr:cation-efflux pump [Chloroflexota bacterium]MDL1885001.1 cation-efflux pump [Anaerolineae bacterium CFX8]
MLKGMTDLQMVRDQVRRVLLVTLALNIVVAVSKIIIGLTSGVLAITADGFHSMVDGSSNVVALVANRLAARPPDDDHPYGHRRFETIAALGIGLFLLVTAWEIISGAVERLQGRAEAPEITPLTFVVMIGTLVANLFVTTYETRAGRRLKSELLIADAAHTRTDVFVTLSVIASMLFVITLGWLWADTAAALVIVVLILKSAWEILRRTSGVLVDTAPYAPQQITAWVEDVPSVERVLRARSRGPADAAYIDVDVQVAPEMTANQTAAIAAAIRDRLNRKIEGITEVEVHFAPRAGGEPDYALSARAQADALGLATHEVRVSDGAAGKVLEMHVEVPPGQTLVEAHERVSQLERNIQASLGGVVEVVTHIEPALGESQAEAGDEHTARCEQIAYRARQLLQARFPGPDWHDLRAQPFDADGFNLTMHVTLPPDTPVEDAHTLAEQAELMLRSALPHLKRVTIHTEPPDEPA